MSDRRQKIQLELALTRGERSEAPRTGGQGTEPPAAKRGTDSPANTERLMEEVCERENLKAALKRVRQQRWQSRYRRDDRGGIAWTT